MMTALFVWMGISTLATLSMVSAVALGARRPVPAVAPDPEAESLIIRGTGKGDSKIAPSFAR